MTILLEKPPTPAVANTTWRDAVRLAAVKTMKPINAIAKFAYHLLRDLF